MPDQKKDVREIPPSRQILLAADKEELVERIESLQADLQRRMELEEEVLHQSLQKGTASLQAQVEEASRRFKVAQQELEAFRLEILQAEGDPAALSPRPYVYEDLSAPPQEGPDRSQLRSLLATFRRLRDERDRLKQEIDKAREDADKARAEVVHEKSRTERAAAELSTLGVTIADLETAQARLRQELEAARAEAERLKSQPAPAPRIEERPAPPPVEDRSAGERARLERELSSALADVERVRVDLDAEKSAHERAAREADQLRASNADFDAEVLRLKHEVARLEAEAKTQIQEQAELGRKLVYEQARTEQLSLEARQLIGRLAETARKLEEARWELENPEQTLGFEQLEKFFDKARLMPLLEKSVRGPEMVREILGAVIGAQEQPLEAARNLMPRIQRPRSRTGLGELRQFVEGMKDADVAGLRRVHDAIRAAFLAPRRQDLLTVDVDSLELVVGRRPEPDLSYWPLVLYVPELQEFWHGEMRTSSENPPKAVAEFLAEGLSRLPSGLDRARVQVRMDPRFYGEPALKVLESKKVSYVVAPPDSGEVRAAARACAYADAGDGWEAGEWTQKGRSSQSPQLRFAALRHARAASPGPSLPYLFRDPRHVYYAFAVDKRIAPRRALETYAAREPALEREHALLRDFTTNRLLARGPESHERFLQLFLLSADLLQWYRRGLK